ncbi:MAG: hypothetical protein MK102_17980 [Fuerstiella sp.]|nr:hypothetical protein [Fuerstiella sp.]
MNSIPVVDITALRTDGTETSVQLVSDQIGQACREFGFFYVIGHGISRCLQERLEDLSRQFFDLDESDRMSIAMKHGGPAWRGYFGIGDELTAGKPDQKEGLYFGSELEDHHPKVKAAIPLHGCNLFPDIDGFRETVLSWINQMTRLGHILMRAIALSLGLKASYFHDRYTNEPLVLFRIFHYPPLSKKLKEFWSVGEHTDYGLLTILKQDHTGGLQIRTKAAWIDAPIVEDSFVCNLGDMLDRMTGGIYRSTPHRVRNSASTGRLSFPFFFDPNWDSVVKPIDPKITASDDSADRWDGASIHAWNGTYGEYILRKVTRVFPDLKNRSNST